MSTTISACILAGGQSKRFHSQTPKVLHEILDLPMVGWVIQAILESQREKRNLPGWELEERITVVTPPFERTPKELWEPLCQLYPGILLVPQDQPRGTADAVRSALPHLPPAEGVLILSGDTPCLPPALMSKILSAYAEQGGGILFVTTIMENPQGYGRVLVENGKVRIVEEKDATSREREIREVNAGIYVVARKILEELIPRITPENAQKEFYLVDLIPLASELDPPPPITRFLWQSPEDLLGVNDRFQLATALRTLNQRVLEARARKGVTFLSPETTWVGPFVEFEEDVVVEPGVHLTGRSWIGRGSRIGAGSILRNIRIGREVWIRPYVVGEDAEIEDQSVVGPFSHLRPKTVIREGSHIGNFVELKNTRIGPHSKANHLSYLGDAEIGKEVNVGAGTITCNYDGSKKHPTIVEDGVFIGSDTQLVAPVRIGHNAYIGAGTTVTHDVPPEALAISRVPQKEIPGYAQRKKSGRSSSPPRTKK
jgi:bifunctional UDP-N-acetylglucosamine pyrophosphorylase/glucosamine-1-phosphate N-acetyltransferase